MRAASILLLCLATALVSPGCTSQNGSQNKSAATGTSSSAAKLEDDSDGADWPAFGRTYGEQHYSPLTEISADTISGLGLAWSIDIDAGNSVSGPLAVDGKLFYTTGYSRIHAVDASSGKPLWNYDPKAAEAAGVRLRQGWGSRGIAWWNGKIYTGTQDGRLIAIDAATGREVWSQMTLIDGDYRFISGPPRAFDGKIIIGHGGGDSGGARGYVTAYDAETGKQLWRFWTVPGNPADGFENDAMKMAAKTWSGNWWKAGGGGTVWNAMTYDRDTDTVLIGTGNGSPWNRRLRSNDEGDNLFLCSIVALDAKTGAYKWHYQINPGESWDYNAAMDMQLADLMIDGKARKVVVQAPKNGFVYVIDRTNGKLISAEKFAKVTWASKIDLKTGRPIEVPGARYPNGTTFNLWPSGTGAHSWTPSALSARTQLLYIPLRETGITINDAGIEPAKWQFKKGNQPNTGVNLGAPLPDKKRYNTSALVAWNPLTQKEVWRQPTPGTWNGGIMATGGGLVFQGQAEGKFNAYSDRDGRLLWSFDAGAPVLAPPISYTANGRQYVTVLTGAGTSAGIEHHLMPVPVDYRTMARRVLTFSIGGKAKLPPSAPDVVTVAEDADYTPDQAAAGRGAATFMHCIVCHGVGADAAGAAPDLRASAVLSSAETFDQIVRQGALVAQGMPKFQELTNRELADLRQYIRAQADALRRKRRAPSARPSLQVGS